MKVYMLILFNISFTALSFAQKATDSLSAKKNMHTQGTPGGISNEQMNKSNNPLANLNSINFQDYYTPKIQGTAEVTNSMYLRGVIVSGRQIIRATLPVMSVPSMANGEYASGLGDFNIFDIIKITGDSAKTEFGVGPLLVIPTASRNALGAGKWQAGAAAVVIHPIKGGHMIGILTTYQHSFVGNDNRNNTSILVFQPVLTINMGNGLYGRSAGATWIFDLQNNRALIPLGIGVGKIVKAGSAMVNMFVEPEFTLYSKGEAQPAYQIFFGMNFQWMKNKK